MIALKVTAAGETASATLTERGMAELEVSEGDTLCLTTAPDGGHRLTRCNSDFARQMPLAEQIMHEDREVLRELAK